MTVDAITQQWRNGYPIITYTFAMNTIMAVHPVFVRVPDTVGNVDLWVYCGLCGEHLCPSLARGVFRKLGFAVSYATTSYAYLVADSITTLLDGP